MSLYRTFASLRRAQHLRPKVPSVFNVIERDPFFARLGSMLNTEIARLQEYNPRVQMIEGSKSYRIDAEVPGFRKEELSIEFPKKRFIRIAGKRRVGGPVSTGFENAAGDYIQSNSANLVESKEAASTEATENVEPTTTTESSVSEAESKEVKASETEGNFQVTEAEESEEVAFTNQWSLPEDVDIDGVKAKLDHGVLSVFLPKKEEAAEAERKVPIE